MKHSPPEVLKARGTLVVNTWQVFFFCFCARSHKKGENSMNAVCVGDACRFLGSSEGSKMGCGSVEPKIFLDTNFF